MYFKRFIYISLMFFALNSYASNKKQNIENAYNDFLLAKSEYYNALIRKDNFIDEYRVDVIAAQEHLFSVANKKPSTSDLVNEIITNEEIWKEQVLHDNNEVINQLTSEIEATQFNAAADAAAYLELFDLNLLEANAESIS
ncbi:hypothetical protein [Fluviispira multicolorata]|uniref:Uncharacterized protein n=1 Tax=Fluviispira multicolorata TaxID=2654512 RepID=A0A833N4R5_9BACT|nr:hypothetical protein [Fluviispira multicolorata]KAB8031071.1 hypothetical protein GCL57_08880 [Fluviispira multicolorata]